MAEQAVAPANVERPNIEEPAEQDGQGARQQADLIDRTRLPLFALLLGVLGLMVVTAHLSAEQTVGLLPQDGNTLARFDVYSFAFAYALLFFLLINLPLRMVIGYRGNKAEALKSGRGRRADGV